MYEDLVKRLKICADDTADCDDCTYKNGYLGTFCMNGLITEAIDALEELLQQPEESEEGTL